jgi:hypothetical protein
MVLDVAVDRRLEPAEESERVGLEACATLMDGDDGAMPP